MSGGKNKTEHSMKDTDSNSVLDSISGDPSFSGQKDGQNLLESVKENLDNILTSSSLKKKTTDKRWWTPEEVIQPLET